MFGSEILDVGVGLVLLYLLLSLICSAIREAIESLTKSRGAHLERGIRMLLHDPEGRGLAKAIYDHPLISGLFAGRYDPSQIKPNGHMRARTDLPGYIPSRNFALAIIDIAARGADTEDIAHSDLQQPLTIESLRASISSIENRAVQRALLLAVDRAEGSVAKAQRALEEWYDSAMDRVSGWYRRRTQWILFAVGLLVTIVVNANTFTIGHALYRDGAMRDRAVALAGRIEADTSTVSGATVAELMGELETLRLPIGWPIDVQQASLFGALAAWFAAIGKALATNPVELLAGWLVTAFAISLGAPFWFDLLNKFMVIRSTVKPREKSGEEGSEDRAPSARTAAPGFGAAPQTAPAPAPAPSPAFAGALTSPATPALAQVRAISAVPAELLPGAASSDFAKHEWADDAPDGGVL